MKYIKLFKLFENVYVYRQHTDLSKIYSWNELKSYLKEYNFNFDNIKNLINLDFKYLTKGSFGVIFQNEDKILKVTFSKNDYLQARKTIGKELYHLPKIYDVINCSNKVTNIYFILMENLEKIPPDLHTLIQSNREELLSFFQTDMTIEEFLYTLYHGYIKTFYKYNLEYQLNEIKKEINFLFPNKGFDLHAGNFMMRGKKPGNDIVFIDLLN